MVYDISVPVGDEAWQSTFSVEEQQSETNESFALETEEHLVRTLGLKTSSLLETEYAPLLLARIKINLYFAARIIYFR